MEDSGQLHDVAALPPVNRAPNAHRTGGYVDPKAGMDALEKKKKKVSCSCLEMNYDSLVIHSVVQSPHRLCYPSSDTRVGMLNFTWNFRFENTFVLFLLITILPPNQLVALMTFKLIPF
jgi:hypothetical protein